MSTRSSHRFSHGNNGNNSATWPIEVHAASVVPVDRLRVVRVATVRPVKADRNGRHSRFDGDQRPGCEDSAGLPRYNPCCWI